MLSTSSSVSPSPGPPVASIPPMRRRLLCPGMAWWDKVIMYHANHETKAKDLTIICFTWVVQPPTSDAGWLIDFQDGCTKNINNPFPLVATVSGKSKSSMSGEFMKDFFVTFNLYTQNSRQGKYLARLKMTECMVPLLLTVTRGNWLQIWNWMTETTFNTLTAVVAFLKPSAMSVDRLRPCHCASSYRLGWWRACRKAEGNLHKWRLALAELSKKD